MSDFSHEWTWLKGSGGTGGARHRGCKLCHVPKPGKGTRFSNLLEMPCTAKLEAALERVPRPSDGVLVTCRRVSQEADKIAFILALRNYGHVSQNRSLGHCKSITDAMWAGKLPEPFLVRAQDYGEFKATIRNLGFEIDTEKWSEPVDPSPHALHVLDALRDKPELYEELRLYFLHTR